MDFLSYFALLVLILVILVIAYGIIAIHDIPYIVAKSRNHPHQDAIHYGGWVSLFTLHAIWPFLWIWATAYHPEGGYAGRPNAGLAKKSGTETPSPEAAQDQIAALKIKIAELEAELAKSKALNPDPTAMDLLLLLIYVAIAYGIFKLFKIPVNGFTLLTAALGGIALIGALVLCMNYNHPFTSQARFYFTTTPIVPGVSGVVIDVPVQAGTPLKAGDVLFRIDPEPFENAVKVKEAALADAIQGTGQLQSSAQSAQKQFESTTSQRETARDTFERFNKLKDTGAISRAEFEKAKNDYDAAVASSDAAEAEAERALLNSTANVGGTNTRVASLQAELDTAKFNLAEATVRAPSDGVVSQMFLRPGMYAAALPLRPVMIFIPKEKPMFVGAFLQNSAQRIEQGSEAEVILPAVPGRFFKGKVVTVGAYITQGQLQPTGNLIDPEQIKGEGRMLVVIDFTDDLSKYQIVPGSNGEVAIYTHHMHHLAILRKVLLRMNSWLNYIFSDGH